MEKQTREQTANAGLKLSRRTFVGGAAMAAAAGGFGASAWASAKEEVERIKAEGWEAHPGGLLHVRCALRQCSR